MMLGLRKGTTLVQILVILAIALVVIVFGVIYLSGTKQPLSDWSDLVQCKSDIEARFALLNQFGSGGSLPSVRCFAHRTVLETSDKERAEQVIADDMRQCWNLWHEGNIPFFGDGQGQYCHVCSTVSISGVASVDNLGDYLATQNANDKGTYEYYFMGLKKASDRKPTSLPTAAGLAVVYVYASGPTQLVQLNKTLFKKQSVEDIDKNGNVLYAGKVASRVTGTTPIPVRSLLDNEVANSAGIYTVLTDKDTQFASIIALVPGSSPALSELGCTGLTPS